RQPRTAGGHPEIGRRARQLDRSPAHAHPASRRRQLPLPADQGRRRLKTWRETTWGPPGRPPRAIRGTWAVLRSRDGGAVACRRDREGAEGGVDGEVVRGAPRRTGRGRDRSHERTGRDVLRAGGDRREQPEHARESPQDRKSTRLNSSHV